MIRNFKFKVVVVEANEVKKSRVLDELLSDISPGSIEFFETYCILGLLKVDKGLFYYKIFDTKLSKAPIIISNSFFPEIHAVIFLYSLEMTEQQTLFKSIYKDLFTRLEPNCVKVLINYDKTPLPDYILKEFPDFHYFSTQDSQILDHIISTLKDTYQVPNSTSSTLLNNDPINNEGCC